MAPGPLLRHAALLAAACAVASIHVRPRGTSAPPRDPPEPPGQAARVVIGSMHCDDDESSSEAESDSEGPAAGACETPLSRAIIARALRPAHSGFDFDDDDDEVVFG